LSEHPSIEQIVDAYWRHYVLGNSGSRTERLAADEVVWAWEEVEEEVRTPTPRTFELLLALADAAKDKQSLGYLGAGPIEDLINWNGSEFLKEVEKCARRSKTFRAALAYVQLSSGVPEVVRQRLAVFIPNLKQDAK
jgi:hypothetical protein